MKPLELDLKPGIAVGGFRLGMTLWDCMNHIRGSPSDWSPTCVAWDDQAPNRSHILVTLASESLRLIFAGVTQRLILIEVNEAGLRLLHYNGRSLLSARDGRSGGATTRRQGNDAVSATTAPRFLHSVFGPTYPAFVHPAYPDELVMAYPGCLFGYPSNPSGGNNVDADSDSRSSSLLKRVIVTTHDPAATDGGPSRFPDVVDLATEAALPPIADGDIAYIALFPGDSTYPGRARLDVISRSSTPVIVDIVIGETHSEDLMCELGAPLRTFYKDDTRLAIHRGHLGGPDAKEATTAYIFNYLSLGLDFVLDGDTNRVSKIVVHSNTPGEILFGRYAKCRWQIAREGEATFVESEDPIDKIKAFLAGPRAPSKDTSTNSKPVKQNHTRDEKVMLLDRAADAGGDLKLERPTELMAYNGIIIEVTQSDCVETVWMV